MYVNSLNIYIRVTNFQGYKILRISWIFHEVESIHSQNCKIVYSYRLLATCSSLKIYYYYKNFKVRNLLNNALKILEILNPRKYITIQ